MREYDECDSASSFSASSMPSSTLSGSALVPPPSPPSSLSPSLGLAGLGGSHGCEHECVNTLGGYECRCKIGFELHSDEKRCESECYVMLPQQLIVLLPVSAWYCFCCCCYYCC